VEVKISNLINYLVVYCQNGKRSMVTCGFQYIHHYEKYLKELILKVNKMGENTPSENLLKYMGECC
jgi:hypothetical protein